MFRFIISGASVLFLSTVIGCNEPSPEGAAGLSGGSAAATDAGQLEQDQDLIRQSLTKRFPGLAPQDVTWQEPEVFYAALTGVVGRDGYSGISQVFSRADALESVERWNETERDMLSPGEELRVHELKKMEPIGYRIVAEYEAGSGDERASYKDTYLVYDQVMLINGKLEKQGREVILQGTSSISADSIIRSGVSED